MVSAGKYISTYNSIGSQFPTWVNHPPSTNSVICNTKDEMVTEVRRKAKDRVDLIKVAGDGDVIRSSGFEEGSITLRSEERRPRNPSPTHSPPRPPPSPPPNPP